MPLYPFEDAKGEVIDAFFPMSRCPKSIRRKGRVYRRIPSRLAGVKVTANGFVSNSLPRWFPYAERFTPEGKPYFDSRGELKRMMDKTKWGHPEDRVVEE